MSIINRIIAFLIFYIFSTSLILANDLDLKSINYILPKIHAESYILMDFDSAKVLLEFNSNKHHNPASLTKMMTSYIVGQAIKLGIINENDIVKINKDAWATRNPIFKGSSLMFLEPGNNVTVLELERGIILQSGNDASVAIANYLLGDQETFVELMNKYAKILGLKNTFFKNVHGLDEKGQFSSAYDMAILGAAIIRDLPNVYSIYKEKEFTFNNIHQINHNSLLWDKNLNVDGIKTGYTKSAGYNLVASAKKDNMRLISVVMGENSIKNREEDSRNLLNWGFRSFKTIIPFKGNKTILNKRLFFGKYNKISLGSEKDIYITTYKNRIKDIKVEFILKNEELKAPIYKNEKVGCIIFKLDDNVISKYPLVSLMNVEKGNLIKNFFDYLKLICINYFNL